MNGNEEHISWQQLHLKPEPPRDLPPVDPVPEVDPLDEVVSLEELLEEVPAPDIYQLLPLDEVETPVVVPLEMLLTEVPVADLVDEPPYALRAERPLAVKPKATLNSTLVSTILAWFVIVPIVLIIIVANHFLPELRASAKGGRPRIDSTRVTSAPGAAGNDSTKAEAPGEDDELSDSDHFDPLMVKFQSRYVLGCTQIPGAPADGLYNQLRVFNKGPAEQRLRVIIMAGELVGPGEALSELANLRSSVSLSPRDSETADCLERLYRDYQAARLAWLYLPIGALYSRNQFKAPSLDEQERALLRARLDWFGDLALAPKEGSDTAARAAVLKPAKTTAFTLVGGALGLGVIGLFGLCFLVIFLIWLFAGWTRRWLNARSPYAGIYAETFALWMLAFIAANIGGYVMAGYLGLDESAMFLAGLLVLGTMGLVFWPVLRGVPWREVRVDLGLIWGKRPLAEPFLGLGCYAMSIPLVAIGAGVTLFLMWVTGQVAGGGFELLAADEEFKGHPFVPELAGAGTWKLIQIFFLAAVVAPIVEETFFRGVLYRHLRDLTGKFGFALSMLFSATLAGFIFAIIHPQTLLAAPVLMAMAYGFTLAREWRGSLIPGMVMHGLHNGTLMLVMSTLLSL